MLDRFTMAYIEAMLFSETDDEGQTLDSQFGLSDIAEDSLSRIIRQCAEFQQAHAEILADPDNCLTRHDWIEQAGHDFWLSRNRHGCGFWETDDWQEEAGSVMDAYSKQVGECYPYIGDDGKLHISGGKDGQPETT